MPDRSDGAGARRKPGARTAALDMALGIDAFFVAMFAIQTIWLEVKGRAAGASALVLLVAVIVGVLLFRARSRATSPRD